MKKTNRLRKRKEFAYIFRNGARASGNYLVLVLLKSKQIKIKIGFSVSKKVGNAINRNKIKRRMRAILTDLVPQMQVKQNYIFIAKPNASEATFDNLKADIINTLKKSQALIN